MTNRLLLLAILALGISGCRRSASFDGPNRFSDPKQLKIAQLQDERDGAALIKLINAKKEAHRYRASLAFASFKDSNAIRHLSMRIQLDRSPRVRKAAGYALGQMGFESASPALIEAIGIEYEPEVRAVLIEALGKLRTKKNVELIMGLKSNDSLTDAGIMAGVYQYSLRAEHPKIADFALGRMEYKDNKTRFFAANTLARLPVQEADTENVYHYWDVFSKAIQPDTRAAFALALGKFSYDSLHQIELEYNQEHLVNQIIIESDPFVKCNLIRSLSRTGEYKGDLSRLDDLVKEAHPQVLATITESLLPVNPKLAKSWFDKEAFLKGSEEYFVLLGKHLHDNITKGLSNKSINEQLKHDFNEYKDNHIGLWILKAMGNDPANFDFIVSVLRSDLKPFTRSGAMALIQDTTSGLVARYPYLANRFRKHIMPMALRSGDVGVISYACYAINDSAAYAHLTPLLDSLAQALRIPKEMETLIDVRKALSILKGEEYPKPEPSMDHKVDWEKVLEIPSDLEVQVKTNKGNFTMKCHVDEAPGSVLNFLELVDKGYYNGKTFHRLVPVFVIQGGCERGDGWGSPDWSQRAEFSNFLTYKEGSVGLASVGPDTEGYQWFVTHSSTPHLTGRFTIFAEVNSGHYVIPLLDVGDRIIEVSRIVR